MGQFLQNTNVSQLLAKTSYTETHKNTKNSLSPDSRSRTDRHGTHTEILFFLKNARKPYLTLVVQNLCY